MSEPMTEMRIRTWVILDQPLERIEEAETVWRLGHCQVSKLTDSGGSGWTPRFGEEACFRREWFDFPDLGRRGWAIILLVTMSREGEDRVPVEQIAGWVPPEREAQADQWIAFLNLQIVKRLAERKGRGVPERQAAPEDDRTFDDAGLLREHIERYAPTAIASMVERTEGRQRWWTIGAVDIDLANGLYEAVVALDMPVEAGSRFRKQPFSYPDGWRGVAIVFHLTTRRGRPVEFLAGWVPPDREADADRWIAFLNGELATSNARRSKQ